MAEFCTRRGDGATVFLSKEQIRQDIEAGAADAADMGGVKMISSDEMERLMEIVCSKDRIVSVQRGNEVVLSYDIGQLDMTGDNGNSGGGVPASRLNGALVHERTLCADTFELAHSDYSIKPTKPVIANEMNDMEVIQNNIIIPYFYGAMPNMGLYYKPDGPFGNPADLMRDFKIEEAQQQAEAAAK
ncbi:MAG: [dimethylamine--corrinoid protein] Co-methyltransferase, partial [Candidatus Methanomethylophilaceae archaeon]